MLVYFPMIWLKLEIWILCIQIVFIKGCFEHHVMDFEEFSLLSLHNCILLKFYQGIFKNWRIDIIWCFANQHQPIIDCLLFNVIEIYKWFTCWHPIPSLLIKQGHIHCFYALGLGGWLSMMYGLWLILLVVISFISQWTSWLSISPIYTKKFVKQDGLKCSNYTNGRNTYTLRVWYGGNKP